MVNGNIILSSIASTIIDGSNLNIIPDNALTPINEQGIKLLISTETPAIGAPLPVTVALNGTNVPVFDKFGNIVYGNQIYRGIVLKGYFGNNGAGGAPHFQLIKLPVRYYCYER